MAKASYEVLTGFARVQGAIRVPQAWSSLEPAVRQFAQARTKTSKREWFLARGVNETDFLEGTTIPDGPKPGTLQFDGRQLPSLATAGSMQHDAPQEARDFFDRLVVRWLGKESRDAIAADLAKGSSSGAGRSVASSRAVQLAARLKLWKMRDHGTAARLAHLDRNLSATEIAQVKALARRPAAYVETGPGQALLPLVAPGPNPTALLPYTLRMLPAKGASNPRAIAMARLKHAPHDTIGFVAEKTPDGWILLDVASVVDQ
jgi:S-adenosylmethionine:diacylglycerol 3-amino-3-carboxypropyl transferase